MTIDQQLQNLAKAAPGVDLKMAIQAISPVIRGVAQQLQHLEYYILQSASRQWLQATLAHKDNPDQPKQVIYAYPSLSAAFGDKLAAGNPDLMAIPMPVAQLLFQLASISPVDSLIFFESETRDQAVEIRRDDLKAMFRSQIARSKKPQVPPDIA